tara:strand:+ start:810 stop:1502 length:693 start_codon:yes stop_codon:yes gene_type:complete
MTISTKELLANSSLSEYGYDHMVFLNFASRTDGASGSITNRIMLKAETVGISTTRNVAPIPIPLSGLVTGESTTMAIDLGIANKSINIGGIITEQNIVKEFDGVTKSVVMTAPEVAQLIHASVDSSFLQKHQNLTELVILYPSRVGDDYSYHAGVTATSSIDELPLIPFDFSSRKLDRKTTFLASTFPDPTDINYKGIGGFIENFQCDFVAGSPFLTFNFSFRQAFTPLG